MRFDVPKYLSVAAIADETPQVKTFFFNFSLGSKPGQFVMLWLPGVDQKPFSVSYDDGQRFGLTIFKRGPMTEKLFGLKLGARLGVSGPYGRGFSLKDRTRYLMVAGGYGAAPLAFLAEEAVKLEGVAIDFLMGAKSRDHLLFEERLSRIKNLTLHIATEDGSKGYRGLITDRLPNLIRADSCQKLVVTCGPELMEKKVLDICNEYNVDGEFSLERYLKCGFGVCGQCAVDDLGLCLCAEGPVVSRETVNQIKEFGKYHRDKAGGKIFF